MGSPYWMTNCPLEFFRKLIWFGSATPMILVFTLEVSFRILRDFKVSKIKIKRKVRIVLWKIRILIFSINCLEPWEETETIVGEIEDISICYIAKNMWFFFRYSSLGCERCSFLSMLSFVGVFWLLRQAVTIP